MVSQQHKISQYDTEAKSWWFIFKPMERGFLKKFLKRDYQHVFAVTRMNNIIMGVDPLLGAVNIELAEGDLSHLLESYKAQGWEVLFIQVKPDGKIFKRRGFLITCATYLAYTVGISFIGVTSWQLRKRLLKLGGQIL